MRTRDGNKEAAIRKKGMEMVVKEGFDGLSMQKLAKAAGVSPATIYIYFKNREDLVNQLFMEAQRHFAEVALKDFHAELSFEKGLYQQWKNRLLFIEKYPLHFKFYEQFRNSPLINKNSMEIVGFKENMKNFVMNAVKRKEIRELEPELFWAMAYGPFYALVRFHLEKKTMMGTKFALTEAKMKQTLSMVVRAFRA